MDGVAGFGSQSHCQCGFFVEFVSIICVLKAISFFFVFARLLCAETCIPPCSLKWRLERTRSETCIFSQIGSCIAMVTWELQVPNTPCQFTQIGHCCWKQGYKDMSCFSAPLFPLQKEMSSSYAIPVVQFTIFICVVL